MPIVIQSPLPECTTDLLNSAVPLQRQTEVALPVIRSGLLGQVQQRLHVLEVSARTCSIFLRASVSEPHHTSPEGTAGLSAKASAEPVTSPS